MELLLLCLKIFFARIADVTLGTIKTNYIVKGKTLFAGVIAFFEVFIWFLVVKEALNTDIQSMWIVISYSAGYATGTILGTYISKTFINSLISVEVITSKASAENIAKIRQEGFGVSVVNAEKGLNNTKNNILFITLNSRNLEDLKRIIRHVDKEAFMVVNESKIVQNGFIK